MQARLYHTRPSVRTPALTMPREGPAEEYQAHVGVEPMCVEMGTQVGELAFLSFRWHTGCRVQQPCRTSARERVSTRTENDPFATAKVA